MYSIYNSFDLINFNLEKDRLGTGASFARDHKKQIDENYSILIKKISEYNSRIF